MQTLNPKPSTLNLEPRVVNCRTEGFCAGMGLVSLVMEIRRHDMVARTLDPNDIHISISIILDIFSCMKYSKAALL